MSRKKEIGYFVKMKISRIRHAADRNEGKAVLAELRKGIGKEPGELPGLFGEVLKDMPESFMSRDGTPTKEEWACYTALTLFALHQRGRDGGNGFAHTDDKASLGQAMRKHSALAADLNSEERMLKRLEAAVSSTDIRGLSYHLRSIINLISGNNISLNYAKLAEDIYEWQFPDEKNKVGLRWGQDFFKAFKEEENNEE